MNLPVPVPPRMMCPAHKHLLLLSIGKRSYVRDGEQYEQDEDHMKRRLDASFSVELRNYRCQRVHRYEEYAVASKGSHRPQPVIESVWIFSVGRLVQKLFKVAERIGDVRIRKASVARNMSNMGWRDSKGASLGLPIKPDTQRLVDPAQDRILIQLERYKSALYRVLSWVHGLNGAPNGLVIDAQ